MAKQWMSSLLGNQFFIYSEDQILIKVLSNESEINVQVGIDPVIENGEINDVDEYKTLLSLNTLPVKTFEDDDFSTSDNFGILKISERHDLLIDPDSHGLTVEVWRDGKKVIAGNHISYEDMSSSKDKDFKI